MKISLSIGLTISFCLVFSTLGYAQKMERVRVDQGDDPVEVFWGEHLAGMATVETLPARNLNVTIMHNFGIVTDEPLQNFFGFDFGPNVRLGVDYGISDRWSLGIGRTSFEKIVDMRTKIALLRQSKDGSVPLSATLKADVGLTTLENSRPIEDDVSYLLALPVARRFGETLSLQLFPMYAHFNSIPEGSGQQKDLFALGVGGEWRFSRRFALMAEYYPVLGERNPGTKNAFALGLNIETGGHIFQLYFASSQWHTEQYIIARNDESFWAGDFRFGFNVNRIFSL